jgi:uncharacterized protein YfcZ (UPF0381/DUF406 family)
LLNQVENEMFELKRKRADIARVLKMVVDQETSASQTLDSLDKKINDMSSEAVSFENKFRDIKGDPSMLLNSDTRQFDDDDCLMV